MFKILKKLELAERIKEFEVEAPAIASKAKPGNFVLVRGDEHGERIPLTIADSDAANGTITLVMQEIGKGTTKLGKLEEGDALLDLVGPLGKDREIPQGGKTICCLAGGLGVAPMYPQTKACHAAGNRVISIIGARNKSLLFWTDRMEAASDKVLYSTDDGSFGHHGFATQLLDDLIAGGETIDEVIAIGPVPHMKAVADCCKKHGVPVVVSLNPIMVDGTGMCGGCRVTVAGETKYACVDGPEFDGADVDFDELIARQRAYLGIEAEAMEADAPDERAHECQLDKQAAELERHERHGALTPASFEQETASFVLDSIERLAKGMGRFDEVAVGMTIDRARREADRCRLCQVPKCVEGCPVEVDIPGFIRAIQDDDLPTAAKILKDKNSLPAICGRVCPQETQCEQLCMLGAHDRPVAVGALERFVADWEARHEPVAPAIEAPKGKRVAIIGSGPGGLTCAGDLGKQGYDVTVFEAFHEPGGVLLYGIPEFRLPKAIVAREVDYVRSLGVNMRTNMVIGKVHTIEELMKDGYGAVFIAVGAGAPAFLGLSGENLIGVYSASEFLTRVNLMKAYRKEYDTPVIVGERVAVIGAGNVAMDAARTALRLGAKEVNIVYRRSAKEVPARAEEVKHAEQEGVIFQFLTNPTRILGDDKNSVVGLECLRMELGEPDDSGRRRPIAIEGSEFEIACDMVIPALGNVANPLLTSSTEGLVLNKWGNITVDPATCATSIPGVYAGGDIVTGSATVIEAMGAGRQAARAIHAYLTEKGGASSAA
jgi:glutamate synthase (NADPH) small chain